MGSSEKSCFVSAPANTNITADGVRAIKQLSPRFNDKQTPCMKHFSLLCVIAAAQ